MAKPNDKRVTLGDKTLPTSTVVSNGKVGETLTNLPDSEKKNHIADFPHIVTMP